MRDRRLCGLKFTRQQPIGPYFVDFCCRDRKLVVEADGSQHADDPRDERRDAFLRAKGYLILRFWNHEILAWDSMVEDAIVAAIRDKLKSCE